MVNQVAMHESDDQPMEEEQFDPASQYSSIDIKGNKR
jgi:hypothetical protein